jgi:hypothetical protein
MKKAYEKPTLVKREKLTEMTAQIVVSGVTIFSSIDHRDGGSVAWPDLVALRGRANSLFVFIGFGGLIDLSPIVAVSTHKLSCLVRRDVMRFDNVAHFRLLAF